MRKYWKYPLRKVLALLLSLALVSPLSDLGVMSIVEAGASDLREGGASAALSRDNGVFFGSADGEDVNTADGDDKKPEYDFNRKVEPQKEDAQIIPDKYNTGCSDALTAFKMDTENSMMAGDVLIIPGSNATRFILDFYYRNKDISGTVIIENYDFSECSFWSYHEVKVDRKIKVVFNNCKFGGVSVGKTDANLSFEFNNCTITNFNGSNSTFNHCQFGHTFHDGLVPFVDIEVNDCFFTDMAGMVTDKGAHIDGTQIYGIAGTDVSNVSYNNCRFEIPGLAPEGTAAYVNACIMLQLEFSNAKNVRFADSIVNGGGYSIYAEAKFDDYTFENVKFEGVRFGAAAKYGTFYPKADKTIEITGVSQTDALYVASVWKEDGQTHFSVTNDTGRDRQLVIYTDKGIFTYTIPACFLSSEFTSTLVYDDFPFDVDIAVPVDCQYAVCFDNTLSGYGKQIRFMNWSGEDVYLTKEVVELVYSADSNEVLIAGNCGKDITFTLTKAGVLTLSGTGATYHYHSAKFPDWVAYKDCIKEIVIGEGITVLGNQIFRNCAGVEKVSLPESLVSIGAYAFGGCVSLEEFIFPSNIASVGKGVLSGTVLHKVGYLGDDWDLVEVAESNDNWIERLDAPRGGLKVRLANKGEKYVYTGSAIKPDIIVTNNGERLVEGVDYTVKYTNNVKASTETRKAKITVTGKGNLAKSNSTTFTIEPKYICDEDVEKGDIVIKRNTNAKPVLVYKNKVLSKKDYMIVGSAKFEEDGILLVRGNGNFTGNLPLAVKVVDELKSFTVSVEKSNFVYDGEEHVPTITVKEKGPNGQKLTLDEHYRIVFGSSKVNAGTVKFTVIGKGEYCGAVTKSYKIKPSALKEGITYEGVKEEGYTYVSSGVKIGADLIVKKGTENLVEGRDYKVTYSNNKKVGTAKFTVSFLGNYKGSKALKGTFTIKKALLSDKMDGLKVVVGDKAYSGKPGVYKSNVYVSVDGVSLKSSAYKVSYYTDENHKNPVSKSNAIELQENESSKTVYVKIEGKGNYTSTADEYVTASYEVCKKPVFDLSKARVTFWNEEGKLTKMEYTGSELEPPTIKVQCKENGKGAYVDVPEALYEVSYVNNVNKGTASVIVTASGAVDDKGRDCAGSKTAKFKIVAMDLNRLEDLLKELFGLSCLD